MHVLIQSKAAIRGHRFGVPYPPGPARRGELRPGTDAHTDDGGQPAVQIDVYSRVLSLRSLHGKCHCLVTYRAKPCLRSPQVNKQNSAAFAEFKFAGINYFRKVQGLSVAIAEIPA